jgi:uncharacterized protein (TIGR00369 family)
MSVKSSHYCFACGTANETGLRMKVVPWEGGCRAVFTPLRRHEGYSDHTHGGIIATLLDEAIVWAARFEGYDVITAELTVRYRKPVPIDQPVEVYGRVARTHGRLVFGESSITDAKGEVLARASAKLIR